MSETPAPVGGAEPPAPPPPPPPEKAARAEKLGRGRSIAVWALIVAASLVALISTLTVWVNRQMLDNDSWRKASRDLIRDPEVRDAISIYTVNQLYENVDVAGALRQRLPENLKPLAEPLAGSLRQRATNGISTMLARPKVEQLFVNASGIAHQKLVNVLENKTGLGISTGNGVVTLDLHELIVEIGTELGIPDSALAKLPKDKGVITVMKSDQLGTVQTGVRVLKVLTVWLAILALGLYALAIYLARGRRREMLRNSGIALIVVGLIVVLIRRYVGNHAIHDLASPDYKASARDSWLIASSILGQIGRAGILYGLIAVIGAFLAGPTRLATRFRGWISPTLNERQGVAWAILAFILLLFVVWGGTHALRQWWGILILALLLSAGLVALRHQTLREFPPGSREPADGAPA